MAFKAYCIVGAIAFLSAWALWFRFRQGRLLTPASGLHLQIFIFYGLGGIAYVFFPDAEPYLTEADIWLCVSFACWPLLIGYGVYVVCEWLFLRNRQAKETILTPAGFFLPEVILLLSIVSFTAIFLQDKLHGSRLNSLPAYFGTLFFPCVLLALTNSLAFHKSGRVLTIVIMVEAAYIGIWSPWRSLLVILGATLMLAVGLRKPRWIPATAVIGLIVLSYLIPFQNEKKLNYDAYMVDPTKALATSLNMSVSERVDVIGAFLVKRINYTRELIYVDLALESGLELQDGKTYKAIFLQLIPRILWKDKPEMANWAGFQLPREIGLLHADDEVTSWAVNMFAEDVYNFGVWSLPLFVPIVFLIAEGIERLLPRLYKTSQAILLANISFFFLLLQQTTVIFAVSFIIALLLVVKLVDLSSLFVNLGSKDLVKPARHISLRPGSDRIKARASSYKA